MSPCDNVPTARALVSIGVFALAMACDALANTDQQGSDQSHAHTAAQTSLLKPETVAAAKLAIDDRLGPSVRVLELRAHPDRWVVQAEDPDRPGRLFQVEYRDGRLGQPLEMTMRGTGELETNLFPLGDVAFEAIPELVEKARLGVDPEDGVVDYVLIRRGLPFDSGVRLRVFVKSPRRDGHLDADQLGQPIE